jgi:hypothetical protein
MTSFWDTMLLLLTFKRQDFFVQIFFVEKLGYIMVWIQFRIWIRNRNRNFSKVGTGTAINRYGRVPQHCLWDPGSL